MIKKFMLASLLWVSMLNAATINTDKTKYGVDEEVKISFTGLKGQHDEWIAIYPAGSSNDFGKIIGWVLTGGTVNGTVLFSSPDSIGNYDIRIFEGAKFLLAKEFVVVDNSPTVETTKNSYSVEEDVVAIFDNTLDQKNDWIAIYPTGTTNEWENLVSWKWLAGGTSGSVNLGVLPIGDYEVRVFFNNSFEVEAKSSFKVEGNNDVATVKTNKEVYTPEESISTIFNHMSGDNEDWIAIYPKGSSSDWGKQITWKWIRSDLSGEKVFGPLPVGEYEVRVFFRNSFDIEAKSSFKVEAPVVVDTLILSKELYDAYEVVHVEYNNMRGLDTDWIGIFPEGAEHSKESAIEWKETKSLVNGGLSFNGLEAGAYEMRAYFDDEHQKTVLFNVKDEEITRVLYDDFEDGIDPRWTKYFGKDMVLLNVGVPDGGVEHTERQEEVNDQHSLRTFNSDGLAQSAGYYFNFENPGSKFKFLEIDMRIGDSSHRFAFGVKVRTKLGDRRIEFASWLNHTLLSGQQIVRGPYKNVLPNHRQAFTQDNYLHVHPAPSDYFVGTSSYGDDPAQGIVGAKMFIHYKINIEEALRVLEPENELLEIILFNTSGGEYDNLALSTH